jgi:hypothetical protein
VLVFLGIQLPGNVPLTPTSMLIPLVHKLGDDADVAGLEQASASAVAAMATGGEQRCRR